MSTKKQLIVVGDGNCGKTCLLLAFIEGTFAADSRPTVIENHVANIEVNDKTIELLLRDTSGQEDYEHLRSLQYKGIEVVLVCFSVMWPTSLENVELKWWPEIQRSCPDKPIVLVGTKNDLRGDSLELEKLQKSNERPVTLDQAEKMAAKINAVTYIECSAKTGHNVKNVFVQAVKAELKGNKVCRCYSCCTLS